MIAAADTIRHLGLRAVTRVPALREIYRDPARRVPAAAALSVALCAAFALVNPAATLALGAAILGVPHVIGTIRHTTGRGRVGRIASGMGAAGGVLLAAAAWFFPRLPFAFVGHLHAIGSATFFFVAAQRRGWRIGGVLALYAGVLVAIAMGCADPWLAPATHEMGFLVEAAGRRAYDLAPHAASRVLSLYAFAQAFHYTVWLRLMPEVDRRGRVPPSLARSWNELRTEWGRLAIPAVALCIATAVALLVTGAAGRNVYFTLVTFHIGVEAAAIGSLKRWK